MDTTIIINLILVALLIVLTAFFVGAEFAVVKVRMSRIEQLISEGNKKAVAVKKLVTNLDYYLSACQLGITVTALGLGTLGEPTVERLLHPVFHELGIPTAWTTVVSYALALGIMTFLHVVLGELAPKTLAIQYTERVTLLLAQPLVLFGKILFPLIWLLNGSARIILRIFGVKPAGHEQAHSEEELKIIMTQSYQSGEINQTELSYMQNILSFDERVAKDIMVPRTRMIVFDQEMEKEELLQIIDENHFTRYPVTEEGDKDKIIGVVNAKEMVTNLVLGRSLNMKKHIHPIPFIHESTRLQDVLVKMKKEHIHIAVVMDEYGGTSGIISMEDILEEIVGDIQDEFDTDEIPDVVEQEQGYYLLNGRVLLDDLEERFGMTFDQRENVDTIGGWMQVKMASTPDENPVVEDDQYRFEVVEIENHQILQVSFLIKQLNEETEDNTERKHG
ncbi:hemolysin family protein [Priestia endophytica]|uniref:Hemolysin, contains CBS domains n=1 Tax=Priestia endophytica DSM 13796 TaxID=1121089 RepID=A0A1I6BYM6_9BACI|nr:hemolysin family protein [Priestia endophytica]KYG33220.1 transporter associated domain protein [Priestia endophytica]MBG9814249.1 transporter associated domain protein [Priestia endophytica]RAS80244.1 transporter associated domain protein [Priestia endophytica]RAS87063.1 transporter associated domain protein [Priestia endophytica]SFQ86032.1 Hemolysin, contains CBS domains [Priestia endophytica DSM 13796]